MNSPRRKLILRATLKDISDAPESLDAVAKAFQDFDIEIDTSKEGTEEATSEDIESTATEEDVVLAKAATDSARDALKLANQGIDQGVTKADSPEESKSKIRDLVKSAGKGGVKIGAQAVLREIASRIFDSLT